MRRWIIVMGALALPSVHAQMPETAAVLTDAKIIQNVHASLDRGLEHMAAKQRADGSWFENNAVNALALLAFMGQGHTPGRGPYRDVLERGKQYLLASQNDDGFIQTTPGAGGGSMYIHALSTLALAEMYGMDFDPKTELALRKAVDLIVRAQSPSGGWRYAPQPGDQDMSVTVMQVVALRAANNAEVPVPAATIEKAIGYVRTCAAAGGGFSYTAGAGATPQMAAAGTLSLQLLGQYGDERLGPALEYLAKIPVAWGGGGVGFFYYFHYYAIQAQYQAGGKWWTNWHPQVRELLLTKQNADGSWDGPPDASHEVNASLVGPDKIYSTAMACLVLEIYNHYLPAYQR